MTFADQLAKIGLEARSIQVQYADAVIKALVAPHAGAWIETRRS